MKKDAERIIQTYTRQPIALNRGEGALVWDVDGKEYIDCVAGIAVNNLGHSHPAVVKAICEQASNLMHVSNLYYIEKQTLLAEELSKLTGMDRLFFCNSGTEAVEAALKLARKVTGRKGLIAATGSFHGRTMGALSTTYKEQYRAPYEPLIGGVTFVQYNDAEALKKAITKDTAAFIVEPIQGEGGVNVPDDEYLPEVREICDMNDILLIFDEVQTGFGRTGEWFGKDHTGVKPDIMTMAKSIAGGFPMGAMAAIESAASRFERGDHAATFGGNPLACAAALASIGVIKGEKLVERSREMGAYFMERLGGAFDPSELVEVRGKGLMIGVELKTDGNAYVEKMRGKGVLINCIGASILRFVPPLVITREQIDRVISLLG